MQGTCFWCKSPVVWNTSGVSKEAMPAYQHVMLYAPCMKCLSFWKQKMVVAEVDHATEDRPSMAWNGNVAPTGRFFLLEYEKAMKAFTEMGLEDSARAGIVFVDTEIFRVWFRDVLTEVKN